MSEERYPCPACGFLVFPRFPGSREKCPICSWQDDGVQLNYPGMIGGLNGLSLWDWQQHALKHLPLTTTDWNGITRHPQWRPLREDEAAKRRGVRITGRMYMEGASGRYYWS